MICPVILNKSTLDMRPTEVIQGGIRITQHQPDNVVVEMNGSSITLTNENTELLRIMLYEAYRSKRWTQSRAEKSARNKALWALAKAQGKQKPDARTEKVYERTREKAMNDVKEITFELPNYDFQDIGSLDYLNEKD